LSCRASPPSCEGGGESPQGSRARNDTVGTITSVDVLINVQGTADLSNISVNGQLQQPIAATPTSKDQCKHGGWKSFTSPSFKNQGQCVSWVEHHVLNHGHGH
jgi:hypothetical protein